MGVAAAPVGVAAGLSVGPGWQAVAVNLKGAIMASGSGRVTLRGGFPGGTRVGLVRDTDVAGADVTVMPAEKSGTVSKDGEVSFSGLEPGASYFVVSSELGRSRRVVARGGDPIEDRLVKPDPLRPEPSQDETPVGPVPESGPVMHTGQRTTRTRGTQGDAFANVEGPEPSVSAVGQKRRRGERHNQVTAEAVEEASKGQKLVSDTPTGELVEVDAYEKRQDYLARTGLTPPWEGVGRPVDDVTGPKGTRSTGRRKGPSRAARSRAARKAARTRKRNEAKDTASRVAQARKDPARAARIDREKAKAQSTSSKGSKS